MDFNYLNTDYKTETIISKSAFITYLFPVEDKKTIYELLAKIKEEHPKASHYCFAWLLDNNRLKKFSDDGEPAKTAGFPIIDVLFKNNLDDCLAVVVRYFGGVKLGAAGLTRAYRSCVAQAVAQAELVEKVQVPVYRIIVNYSISDAIGNLLKNSAHIISVSYKEKVEFIFYCFNESVIKNISDLSKGLSAEVIAEMKVNRS